MVMLKCTECGSNLKLSVGFTGCDWDTEAGEGSGFDTEISLICTNETCALVYSIGNVKDFSNFSEAKNKCFKSDYYSKKPNPVEEVIYPVPERFLPTKEEINQAAQRLLEDANQENFGQYKKDKPKLRIVKEK